MEIETLTSSAFMSYLIVVCLGYGLAAVVFGYYFFNDQLRIWVKRVFPYEGSLFVFAVLHIFIFSVAMLLLATVISDFIKRTLTDGHLLVFALSAAFFICIIVGLFFARKENSGD
jgi:hypothetical protein